MPREVLIEFGETRTSDIMKHVLMGKHGFSVNMNVDRHVLEGNTCFFGEKLVVHIKATSHHKLRMSPQACFTKYQNARRPVAQFHPSPWDNLFQNYTPEDQATRKKKEEEIKQLKEKVKMDLIESSKNPMKELKMIDAILCLGVAYHFEQHLEEIFQCIFDNYYAYKDEDLYYTSLRFRMLRQYGFHVSSDIFVKFKDEDGNSDESLSDDVEGLLSLYEASDVRTHGEDILDEALAFTTTHLISMVEKLSDGAMKERVNHALKQPLHKGMRRLESRWYISMYEREPSHNETLLKLAKLDFNFVLSLHKLELRNLGRWWNDIFSRCSFARDRLVEVYFWTLVVFYEPQYSLARKLSCLVLLLASIIDDIYDAYGLFEELELFTNAVSRWDKSCAQHLPDYMKFVYECLLDTFEEFEHDLAEEGTSHLVHYLREQMKILCEMYMQEARWRHAKQIPTYEEYMKMSTVSFGSDLSMVVCLLGMGKLASKEAFEWVGFHPKFVVAIGVMGRLKNDMGGNKFQQGRDHIPSAVECYTTHNGVSENEARETLNKHVDNAWKDVNEGLLRPHPVAWPLLYRLLGVALAVEVAYNGEDGYTVVSQTMKEKIALVLIDPVV